jgi:tetratricopeptide (TPR) repeat protein
MAEPAAGKPRYTAFLSYSHKDAAAAGRLHRRLETYRLPKRLVGKATPRGPVPERLWPIFRDRDELPAATDLSETVREALAQSGSLIVVCSPHSAESLWVAEEIRVFRELHPDRPILAAVIDGDPPACFPAALRAFGRDGTWHEPLATDLRPQGDGPQLGLLKLVAGVTGVGLDDLVQRDATRRIRRVTAVTVAALVAMLITTALAVFAFDARRDADRQRAEAERQRAAAEGQIEFMLTELRSRLRGVGSIEIMQAVNAHALRYYGGQQALSGLPADSLLRRARVLLAIGDDNVSFGNFAAALVAFREAHRTTAEQLARNPEDPERMLQHMRSESRIGRFHAARREWPSAQSRYVRAAAMAENLLNVAPDNPDYMMAVGSTVTDLGDLQLNGLGDPASAQKSFERAVHWFGSAVQARAGNADALRAHANAYAHLADTFFMRESWRESLQARLRQHAILERLHGTDPANLETGYRLALAERGLAVAYAKVENRADARSHMIRAFDWSSRLTRRDPRNTEWWLLRASIGCDLYFRDLGMPSGTSRAMLRDEIRRSVAPVAASGNPNASRLANCLSALSSPSR